MSRHLVLAGRWLIVALGLAIMAGVGADLWRRAQPAAQYARAIAAGYAAPGRAMDPEAVEDEQVTQDANEAGYDWAERRGLAATRPEGLDQVHGFSGHQFSNADEIAGLALAWVLGALGPHLVDRRRRRKDPFAGIGHDPARRHAFGQPEVSQGASISDVDPVDLVAGLFPRQIAQRRHLPFREVHRAGSVKPGAAKPQDAANARLRDRFDRSAIARRDLIGRDRFDEPEHGVFPREGAVHAAHGRHPQTGA
jgi:hypothetical protein